MEDVCVPKVQFLQMNGATNDWQTEVLGNGGYSKVYKGVLYGIPVAIKKIGGKRDNTVCTRQFTNELKALSKFRHPNIIQLYGWSSCEEINCLALELMSVNSVQFYLDHKPRDLKFEQRLQIASNLISAVYYIHHADITPLVHSDIKPANILLTMCGTAKLADFGSARKSSFFPEKTYPIMGTKAYMPNEYRHQAELSTLVDVYAFGLVLLQLLTDLIIYDDLYADGMHLSKFAYEIKKRGEIESLHDANITEEWSPQYGGLIDLSIVCMEPARSRDQIAVIKNKFDQLMLDLE